MRGRLTSQSIPATERPEGRVCFAAFLLVSVAFRALASDLPPAQLYLQQATLAAHEIQLGGDQSAARREIALALMALDPQAARASLAGIGRPSDAARVLEVTATSLAAKDPKAAQQAAALGGRLLQRIAEPERRAQESRLFLQGIAALGAEAPAAVPELPVEEARTLVVAALADRDPQKALDLCKLWSLKGPAADNALAALAPKLAASKPQEALALADGISLPALRDGVLWRIAEQQSPADALATADRMQEAITRAAAISSAARRLMATDPEAAAAALKQVSVSPVSAQAELAVEMASRDETKGVELARPLPEPARSWALGQIALSLAAAQPARAEGYLAEAGAGAEVVALAASRMAASDPARALRLARALPAEARARALADVVVALAPSHLDQATALLTEITASPARDCAVVAVACQLAGRNFDAATSVLGLISDTSRLPALRARLAAAASVKDPATARRVLESLPQGDARTRWALQAARLELAAGTEFDAAVSLAALGAAPDLARRWLLPEAARQGQPALGQAAEKVQDPYCRSLGLVDVARVLEQDQAKPRPDPARARMMRPILEWEGS